MIAVTGMHRSGTSCITGLLVKCGLSLGSSHPLLNEPRPDNAKGHFENLGALSINETILQRAGGSWCSLPCENKITETGELLSEHIKIFSDNFNGDLFKDPRTSITSSFWEKYCSRLEVIIFCVRNPLGVAASLLRRNNIPAEAGINLWFEYNKRFFNKDHIPDVFYINYDNIGNNTVEKLSLLLKKLGHPAADREISENIDGFYEKTLNHDPEREDLISRLPSDIQDIYKKLYEKTEKFESSI